MTCSKERCSIQYPHTHAPAGALGLEHGRDRDYVVDQVYNPVNPRGCAPCQAVAPVKKRSPSSFLKPRASAPAREPTKSEVVSELPKLTPPSQVIAPPPVQVAPPPVQVAPPSVEIKPNKPTPLPQQQPPPSEVFVPGFGPSPEGKGKQPSVGQQPPPSEVFVPGFGPSPEGKGKQPSVGQQPPPSEVLVPGFGPSPVGKGEQPSVGQQPPPSEVLVPGFGPSPVGKGEQPSLGAAPPDALVNLPPRGMITSTPLLPQQTPAPLPPVSLDAPVPLVRVPRSTLCDNPDIAGTELCTVGPDGNYRTLPECNGENMTTRIANELARGRKLEQLINDELICEAVRSLLRARRGSAAVTRAEAAATVTEIAKDIRSEAAKQGDATVARAADAVVKSGGAVWAPWMEIESSPRWRY